MDQNAIIIALCGAITTMAGFIVFLFKDSLQSERARSRTLETENKELRDGLNKNTTAVQVLTDTVRVLTDAVERAIDMVEVLQHQQSGDGPQPSRGRKQAGS